MPGPSPAEAPLEDPPSTAPPEGPTIFALSRGTTYAVSAAKLLRISGSQLVRESHLANTMVSISCASDCQNVRSYLQLDDQPLRAPRDSRSLASLLNEDEEIAPGQHQLFGYAFSGDQLAYDRQILSVESEGRAEEPSAVISSCQLVLPSGTYNGAQSNRIELLALYLASELPQEKSTEVVIVDYELSAGDFISRGSFASGTSAIAENLPPGDIKVSITCRPEGGEAASKERVITINPELGISK